MKKFFYCIILIIFYLLFSSFVTSNHKWLLFAMQIVTILISIWICLKENKKLLFFLLLFIPFSMLIVIGVFVEQPTGYIRGLPYIILLPFLSYLSVKIFEHKSIHLGVILLLLIPINSFIIFPNWFIFNIEKDHTLLGEELPKINLVDEFQNKVNFSNDKILVLDFWTTNCGVCFKKFPEFEKLKGKYRNNSDIEFYSINVPIKGNSFSETLKIVKDLNYRFKTIYAIDQKEIQNRLDFNAYPKLFLIKDNKIIYSGGLHTQKYIIVNNIITKIESLL